MILEPKCKHEPCLCLAKIGSVGRAGLSGRLRLVAVVAVMLILAILTGFFFCTTFGKKSETILGKKTHAANKGPQARAKHIATKNRAILFCFLLAAVCSQPQNITRMQNTTGQASTHSYLIITCPAALLCPDPCLHVEANPLVKPS